MVVLVVRGFSRSAVYWVRLAVVAAVVVCVVRSIVVVAVVVVLLVVRDVSSRLQCCVHWGQLKFYRSLIG